MLKIETDYDVSEKGPFRTRIEAFVEMLNKKRGRKL
ncbi:MAG: 2-hydroxyacyl-CoA dehydratase family protein [Thermodesulfobacteriota bacterium]